MNDNAALTSKDYVGALLCSSSSLWVCSLDIWAINAHSGDSRVLLYSSYRYTRYSVGMVGMLLVGLIRSDMYYPPEVLGVGSNSLVIIWKLLQRICKVTFTTHRKLREVSIRGWEYSCCNTSLVIIWKLLQWICGVTFTTQWKVRRGEYLGLWVFLFQYLTCHSMKTIAVDLWSDIYYPPEVRRGEYWGLGVFLLQYFTCHYMKTIAVKWHNRNIVG